MIAEFYIKHEGKLKKVHQMSLVLCKEFPPTFQMMGFVPKDLSKAESFEELANPIINQKVTFTKVSIPYLEKDNTAIYLFDADNYLKQ